MLKIAKAHQNRRLTPREVYPERLLAASIFAKAGDCRRKPADAAIVSYSGSQSQWRQMPEKPRHAAVINTHLMRRSHRKRHQSSAMDGA
ncbi:unnamed protein product [Strongylus vulgaris]|uniref:Uncharacterized protein n=1 Tax=Strongylus vulgaris TaxID=40348 RepID=A0A3P7JMP3_STRVU|nr:unnamed protein product [Strongylus vulgaris]